MKVIDEYPRYHFIEEYVKSHFYCPNCGQHELWCKHETYITDREYICTNCSSIFYHQINPDQITSPRELGILNQLKTGIMAEPITKKG